MGNYQILSLDESGKPIYSHLSKEFALVGIVIDEKAKDRLDKSLRKLKRKFFKDETIILHYAQIARKIGVFEVLKNKQTEINFWSDILSILGNPKINYLFIIVNKNKAKKESWLEKTIA